MSIIERKAMRLYYAGAMAEERRRTDEIEGKLRRDLEMYRSAMGDLWNHPEFNQDIFCWVEDFV